MKKLIISIMIALLILPGCGSMKSMSREERVGLGAEIGSFFGWLFGGLIGETINDERGGEIGSFIGTAVGGIAGASIAADADNERRSERRERRDGSPRPLTYAPSSQVLIPDLQIQDILLEEDSLSHNRKIDAGEICRISFVIVNHSFQEALNVLPIVRVQDERFLELSEPVRIPRVRREDPVTYEVTVHASPELPTGEVTFSVQLQEGRGNGTEVEFFTVETRGH